MVFGIVDFKADGQRYFAKGNWTYNIGADKSEEVVGADGVHGFSEKPQAPFIEGVITDQSDLDLKKLLTLKNATVTLSLRNGKVVVLRQARYAGDGNVTTEEGEIEARFVGLSGEEVK